MAQLGKIASPIVEDHQEDTRHSRFEPGGFAAEGIEAKLVGKEPNLGLLLRTVAVATAGKTGMEWDFSPPVAADVLLPCSLPGVWSAIGVNRLQLEPTS